jgi:hypothetical protein
MPSVFHAEGRPGALWPIANISQNEAFSWKLTSRMIAEVASRERFSVVMRLRPQWRERSQS